MKKIVSVFLCLGIFLLCGCSAYINESEGDKISPLEQEMVSARSASIPLYFRFYSEEKLVRLPISIETGQHQKPEYFAINALIAGPTGAAGEAKGCFGNQTSLVNIDDNGEHLYVTLSSGFLLDTKANDTEQTRANRRLALYSIVNTVCEMGSYRAVQFFISYEQGARRPNAYEVGISPLDDGSALGPLTRSTELILTPSNCAKQALKHYSALEWSKLYYYLSDDNDAQKKLPILEELINELQYKNLILSEFSAEDNYTISDDGRNAIVQVTLKVRYQNSAQYTVEGFPLKLVQKNSCWYVCFESFLRALEVSA